MDAILNYVVVYGGVAAIFVLAFDRLSKLTPSESDDKVVAFLYRVFTILGVRVPDVK